MTGGGWFQGMLDGLAGITRFGEWFRAFVRNWLKGWAIIAGPLVPIISVPLAIYWALKHSKELLGAAMVKAGEYYSPQQIAYALDILQTMGTYIRCVARFFPLTDTLVVLSAILTVRLAFTVYRFVKSWIPTVSG